MLLSFSPYIRYQHHGKEDREKLTVTIVADGYEYGKITIEEGHLILADTHHLQFNTRFQNYVFNKAEKTFEITGSSEKMGDYKVLFLLDEDI